MTLGKKSEVIIFLAIILLIGLVRFLGVDHLVEIPNGPEGSLLNSVKHMIATKTLDSNFYHHPDNVMAYVLIIVFNAASLLKVGSLMTVEIFNNFYSKFFVLARSINVIFSLITVIMCYLIGNRFKPRFGLIAACFTGLFASYHYYSGLIYSDICLTMLLVFVIYFSICYLQENKNKYLYTAVVFCALSTIQKYPGALSILIIIYMVVMKNILSWRNGDENAIKNFFTDGIKLSMLYIASIMVFAPELIVNFIEVIRILKTEARDTHLRADGLIFFGNLWYYIKIYINQAGIAMLVASIAGIIITVKSRVIKEFAPILFGLVMMIIISKLGLHWERWSLPLHITLLLSAAYFFAYIHSKDIFRNKFNKGIYIKTIKVLGAIVFCYSILIMSSHTYIEVLYKNCEDTRIISLSELEKLEIDPESTWYQSYTSFSHLYGSSIFETPDDAEYIMISSYIYDRHYKNMEKYHDDISFYEQLQNEYTLLYEIKPWKSNRNMRDANLFDNVYVRFGWKQLYTNLIDIYEYYTTSRNIYFGPTIKVFKK